MSDLYSAIKVYKKILFQFNGEIYIADKTTFVLSIFSVVILLIVELCEEVFKNKITLINSRHTAIRWCTYFILITIILLFGVFDSSQFIYVSF